MKVLQIVLEMNSWDMDKILFYVSDDIVIKKAFYRDSSQKILLIYNIMNREVISCGCTPFKRIKLKPDEHDEWSPAGYTSLDISKTWDNGEIHVTEFYSNESIDRILVRDSATINERQFKFKRIELLDKYLGRLENVEYLGFKFTEDEQGFRYWMYDSSMLSEFGKHKIMSIDTVSEIHIDAREFLMMVPGDF